MRKRLASLFLPLMTLCCWGISLTNASALVIEESFEDTSCVELNNSFYLNCFNDWIAVSGTPDNHSVEMPAMNNITAHHEKRYARMFTGVESCDDGLIPISESIALTYPFKACTEYTISFWMKKRTFDPAYIHGETHSAEIKILLANGLQNSTDPSNCEYILPSINSSMQVLRTYNFNNESDWKQYNITFTTENNFSHLAFFPRFTSSVSLERGVFFFVDYVTMSEGAEPEYPPFFLTTEGSQTQETEFCIGEDIWVCLGDADFDWDHTKFDLYEEPSGDLYTSTGTLNSLKENNCYNLSQFLRDAGMPLPDVDESYEIKMSIEHPDCGWVESFYSFDVVCCEAPVDASFSYSAGFSPNGPFDTFWLYAWANTNYTGSGGQHEFCLEVDIDGDGTIDQEITCSPSPFFYMPNLSLGSNYYLNHCVETICGLECWREEIKLRPDGEDVCEVSGFRCLRNDDDFYLSWAMESHVASVEVQFTPNDPACGCKDDIEPPFTVTTTDRFLRIDNTSLNCFSFRVRATCINEGKTEVGEWSEDLCLACSDLEVLTSPEEGSAKTRSEANTSEEIFSPRLYPNPFQDLLHLQLPTNGLATTEGLMVEVRTTAGQLLFRQAFFQDGIIDLATIPYQGLLLVTLSDGKNRSTQKVLKM